MANKQGEVLEVSSLSDVSSAASELLHDHRIDAIIIRSCFNELPDWDEDQFIRSKQATKWINELEFSEGLHGTTCVLKAWLFKHHKTSVKGVSDGWRYDKRTYDGTEPHIDYLRPHRVADVVGGLSLSICREGSGTFFTQRLRELPLLRSAPTSKRWNNMRRNIQNNVSLPFGTAIEHEAGDGIMFAAYPQMTIHGVIANGLTSEEQDQTEKRVAELFDYSLVVPHTWKF